jgi:hypothetical protein
MKYLFFALSTFFISQSIMAADPVCTPLLKSTKYKVAKGDHIAYILRQFGQEPVFSSSGSLNKLLKINQIENPDLIEPGDEITMPFRCEEDVAVWSTVDKGAYRLISLKQNTSKTNNNDTEIKLVPAKAEQTPSIESSEHAEISPFVPSTIVTEDQKLNEVLKSENGPRPDDIEADAADSDKISEALRYRMICEGEWTGTQCITRYSTVYLEGSGWYNRYDGTDPTAPGGQNNKGILLSKLNPQIQFGWQNYWTENFKTELSAGFQNSEILPEAREIPIERDKKFLSNVYLQGRYEVGAFGFGVGLKNHDKLFYRFRFSGLSAPCLSNSNFAGCGVFVHVANIMSYFANANWMFYQAGKFSYDVKASFYLLGQGATGGFEVYNGTATDIEFTVRHDRVREYLYGKIHYGVSSQDTSIEVQTSQNLGFAFGYAWKLKDW